MQWKGPSVVNSLTSLSQFLTWLDAVGIAPKAVLIGYAEGCRQRNTALGQSSLSSG
jgi:hypothetical protein